MMRGSRGHFLVNGREEEGKRAPVRALLFWKGQVFWRDEHFLREIFADFKESVLS